MLEGCPGPAGPPDPHAPLGEAPNPRGFRFVLVFTHQLWFLEASKLWGNSRERHTLRARLPLSGGSPSAVACAAHQAWPRGPAMREAPPQQPVSSFLGTNGRGECGAGHGQPRSSSLALGLLGGGPGSASWDFPQGRGACSASSGLALSPLPGGTWARKCQPPVSRCRATSSLGDVGTLQVFEVGLPRAAGTSLFVIIKGVPAWSHRLPGCPAARLAPSPLAL